MIWFLHKAHIRLGAKLFLAVNLEPKLVAEYSWQELWSALIGLLAFLSSKLDNLTTTGGVEQLARAVSPLGTALVLNITFSSDNSSARLVSCKMRDVLADTAGHPSICGMSKRVGRSSTEHFASTNLCGQRRFWKPSCPSLKHWRCHKRGDGHRGPQSSRLKCSWRGCSLRFSFIRPR